MSFLKQSVEGAEPVDVPADGGREPVVVIGKAPVVASADVQPERRGAALGVREDNSLRERHFHEDLEVGREDGAALDLVRDEPWRRGQVVECGGDHVAEHRNVVRAGLGQLGLLRRAHRAGPPACGPGG